jgi:hypothetical protein
MVFGRWKRKTRAVPQTVQKQLHKSKDSFLPGLEPPSVTASSCRGQVQDETPPTLEVENLAPISEGIQETSASPESPSLESTPEPSTSAPKGLPQIAPDAFGDRKQTEERYKRASEELSAALELPRNKWGSFDVTPLGNLNGTDPFPKIRAGILEILEKREEKAKGKGFGPWCKRVVERVFTATSPFAKNFLMIANNAQSVIPVSNRP